MKLAIFTTAVVCTLIFSLFANYMLYSNNFVPRCKTFEQMAQEELQKRAPLPDINAVDK